MTADERYAECRSLEELRRLYNNECRMAETLEFQGAIDRAYGKHYSRLKTEEVENDT